VRARIALAALALVAAPLHAAADPARYMPAELLSASMAPKPGSTVLVGFRFTPKPGWHGYWSNPGDSGFAPGVDWSSPGGIRFSPLLHPAPTLIGDGGISSFVHDGPHVLLSRMTIPRSIAPGTHIPVAAKLSWAACTATQCVPLRATLTLELVAGDGTKSADSAVLAKAAAKLPKPAPNGTFTADGKARRLLLPSSLALDPRRARFFPDDNDSFVTASASAGREDGRLAIAGQARSAPATISGVVTDGRSSYRLTFERAKAELAAPETATPDPAAIQNPALAAASDRAPAAPPPAPEPQRTAEGAPWLPIAIVAIALGGAALLLRRRTRDQRPRT
jgi:DsbC/DsbD-like thiol-disulfide interchange protein